MNGTKPNIPQETHILHQYDGDLYGRLLKVCICGYIRPERDFTTLEALVAVIKEDIELAKRSLGADSAYEQYRTNEFFLN